MQQQIKSIFESQQQTKFLLRKTDAAIRISKLKRLKEGIERYEDRLYAAIHKDLRKSTFEAAATELIFTYAEIDHAIKHLSDWMKPKRGASTLSSFLSTNKIYYEPRGTCLIIAPWNYPFQLSMSPLVSAIAAGNCAILKPSELSAETSKVMEELIKEIFAPEEITCVQGDAELSKFLLTLPFDHIFFTGSTAIGKVVMEAAAKNLSSVTLELGGKSPAIIDKTANVEKTAEKIAWGKLVNAGQTCIAPDYVLIEKGLENTFVEAYKKATLRMFFKNDAEINKETYGKIINEKQFKRLQNLIASAIKDGATLAWGGQSEESSLTILPTVLSNVAKENSIMQEEIFGPILPIITFKNLQQAIDLVNEKSKPLALYIFSEDKKNSDKIINETSAGGTCVNDVLVHISNPNLPFGGVNGSGMGSSHGIFGFKTFSHERAVVFQSRLGITKMIYPPYENKMGLLKWLKKIM